MTDKKKHSGEKRNKGDNERVGDAMTRKLVSMKGSDSIFAAACKMRDEGVGDVLVTEGEKLKGIVTDRDIVVRAAAENKDLNSTELRELCQREVFTVNADASITDVMRMMEAKAVRRIPVVEGEKPIGIVSLGDLALLGRERDALEAISAAAPNN